MQWSRNFEAKYLKTVPVSSCNKVLEGYNLVYTLNIILYVHCSASVSPHLCTDQIFEIPIPLRLQFTACFVPGYPQFRVVNYLQAVNLR